MIVRNSAETINECLSSIVPFVDEVSIIDTGSTDDTEAIARRACLDYGVDLVWGTWEDPERHPEHGWISNFAAARQLSVDQSTGDLWCWIDADTRMVSGRAWRDEVDAFFGGHRGSENPGLMLIPYDYERDTGGRVVRRVIAQQVCVRGGYAWEGPVHELPIAQQPGLEVHKALYADFRFEHIKAAKDYRTALERNMWILENHIAKGREMTPRLWQNLGSTQQSLERFPEAVVSLTRCLDEEPLGMESYSSLLSRACCHRSMGNAELALQDFLLATRRFPERRTPYVYLAETASDIGEWDKALHWLAIADKLPENDGSTVYNPVWIKWGALQIRARCLRELGMFEAALELYQQLSTAFPENAGLAEYIKSMVDEMERGRLYRAYKIVTDGQAAQMAAEIWRGCPDSIAHYPEPLRVHRPTPASGAFRVALYCPMGRMSWGPHSLESGVGGSEEAAILLSRELTKRGCHVEIYGQPERQDFGQDEHGVVWLPQYAYRDEPVDVFIAWRHPRASKLAPSAGMRVLWLHDVVKSSDFTPENLETTDLVFCLSQFHARPLASVPGWSEKVVITKNGMSEEYLADPKPVRRRHSFAYYSSMDRGVDLVLELWPQIKAELPDANLDIYYGFTQVYLDMMKSLPHLRDLKTKIEGLLEKSESVIWHGMVGQKKLAESMANTEFWLYPTSWPETSCITAMKCQAMGCIPITSRYQDSGVPETTQFDLGPPGRPGMIRDDATWQREWLAAVLAAAKKPPQAHEAFRQEMSRWARKTYSWSTVADDWMLLFRTLLAKNAPVGVSP